MQIPPARTLTPLDDSYSHQIVAPMAVVSSPQPTWCERCYHQLHVHEGLTLNAGRQVYAYDGRRFGFVGIATDEAQHCVRLGGPFAIGEDPNDGRLGSLLIETVRPLREIRLVLDDPALPVSLDLTYRARFPAVPTEANRIEVDGVLVTEYMNFFQSGTYSGAVVVDGIEHAVRERHGFRDRGWGFRKHEGSPRRGLVVASFCELPDEALYILLYETASGRRVFTNGWLIGEDGVRDVVTACEHDLVLDGTLLTSGTLDVAFASGRAGRLEFATENRCFLAGVGYTPDEAAKAPGVDRFDLTDPAVVARLDGQNDNGGTFRFDGVEGYGYVETGVGVHARYRPV